MSQELSQIVFHRVLYQISTLPCCAVAPPINWMVPSMFPIKANEQHQSRLHISDVTFQHAPRALLHEYYEKVLFEFKQVMNWQTECYTLNYITFKCHIKWNHQYVNCTYTYVHDCISLITWARVEQIQGIWFDHDVELVNLSLAR